MVRLRTRWNLKDRPRRYEETGSLVAANLWKLAARSVLNLENEGFQTDTNSGRLDMIGELMAYAIHLVDRFAYAADPDGESRELFVSAVARRSVGIMLENRHDTGGIRGDEQQRFIALINQRSEEYAVCGFDAKEGPDFTMRRILGGHLQRLVGGKDRKWMPDYVIDAEAPEIFRAMKRLRAVTGTSGTS